MLFTLMEYVWELREADSERVLRHGTTTGYFTSLDLLEYWMKSWSGCEGPAPNSYWKYYMTDLQRDKNSTQKPVAALPYLKLGWYGTARHHYEYNSDRPKL